MHKSQFTEAEILTILKRAEAGVVTLRVATLNEEWEQRLPAALAANATGF